MRGNYIHTKPSVCIFLVCIKVGRISGGGEGGVFIHCLRVVHKTSTIPS